MESLNLPEWANTAAHISAILGAIGLAVGFSKPICRFLVKVYREIVFLFQQQKCYSALNDRVGEILTELKPNGGGSIRDAVNRIEDQVSYFSAARRAQLNTSPIALAETDATGALVWSNKAHARLMGVSVGDVVGAGWVNTIAPNQREWVEEVWIRAVEQQREFHENIIYQHTNGTQFEADVIAHPIKVDGVLRGYVVEIHPIDQ